MRKKIPDLPLISLGFLTPILVGAETFRTFAGSIIDLLNKVANLVIGLALLAFVIGAVKFIATAGDEKGRETGKQLMVWGILAIFLMFAIWGVVSIIQNTFFGS